MCKYFLANSTLHMRIVFILNKWIGKLNTIVTMFLLFKMAFLSNRGILMC